MTMSLKKLKNIFSNVFIYVCVVFLAVSLFFITFCLVSQKLRPSLEKLYPGSFVVLEPENLSNDEKKNVDNLILKNKIIPADEIYGKTLSYYDSLVTVLIAFITFMAVLLSALGFASWFSLKGKAKEELQEIKDNIGLKIGGEIKNVVSSEYYKTWLVHDVVGKYISENKDRLFPDVNNTYVDIDKVVDRVYESVMKEIKDNRIELKIGDYEQKDI